MTTQGIRSDVPKLDEGCLGKEETNCCKFAKSNDLSLVPYFETSK
jgi:hypothetical protein